jgi:elongation factor Ts
VLLDQPYIREGSKSVDDLVKEVASKVGENVVIRRFVRYQLGEEA